MDHIEPRRCRISVNTKDDPESTPHGRPGSLKRSLEAVRARRAATGLSTAVVRQEMLSELPLEHAQQARPVAS